MQKVQIGTKVNRLGIQRLSVGDGATCRAILIDPDPRMKHVAYDQIRKRRVEVDQDMCIKYGLRPQPTFYYLVAKLNTDLNGEVIGDKFTVEYLQLSDNLNNEFSNQVMEQGIPKSLSLTKVKKSADGKDFSYIKVTLSNRGFEDNKGLWDKINKLRSDPQFIETCWSMIDADTSLTKAQYEQLLAAPVEQVQQISQPARPQIGQTPRPNQAQIPQSSAMPQVPNDFASQNDFGDVDFNSGDEFSEGF